MWPEPPFSPVTGELRLRHPDARRRIKHALDAVFPDLPSSLPERFVSGIPLVASPALATQLDRTCRDFIAAALPQLGPATDPQWGSLPAPDVVCVDYAIARDGGGWQLRLVEAQAFPTITATLVGLHRACTAVWPELASYRCGDARPAGEAWESAIHEALAPTPDTIQLEHDHANQGTAFDHFASQALWGVRVTDPSELRRGRDGRVWRKDGARRVPVGRILNRLVIGERADFPALRRRFRDCRVDWHSHPAWYYRFSKAALAQPALQSYSCSVEAADWRRLGLPAEQLVLKPKDARQGAGLRLDVTEQALDTLPDPHAWVVQVKYEPLHFTLVPGQAPVHAEIRCVVALGGGPPRTLVHMARLSRGRTAGMSNATGEDGAGVALVFSPP